eukprot:CAMPEP_0184338462 /NCGR_PEP_ID=MMETSP1089-20130417/7005_1 /TAXON_ID=38269 ORGANISM="Gloeochaete wittrockiana, Strain SAG46.84" /NCGR_SAMPLE_ID=MMETSP1089 /ASSEMBLY_ACC=CAM_ASM_000445 /LENGTH=375 /DNA_ID=CAMNT_0026664985 /DNA_START=23 /DNA_END=1150 /DNA_ORIENTATION=-
MNVAWALPFAIYILAFLLVYINTRWTLYSNFRKCCEDLDLNGKVVIVTGGSDGIGKEAARILYQKGAHVIIASRNDAKLKAAVSSIKQEAQTKSVVGGVKPGGVIESALMDLASLASVRYFASKILDRGLDIDFLVLNAGVGYTAFKKTEDGLDLTMQTNHFGHFLLLNLLLPNLVKNAGRVITVSSSVWQMGSHSIVKQVMDPVAWGRFRIPALGRLLWYGNTKYANILMSLQLHQLFKSFNPDGGGATVMALHPGIILTSSFTRNLPPIIRSILSTFSFLSRTSEEGAFNIIYSMVSKDLEDKNGMFINDCRISFDVRSQSYEQAEQLWAASLKAVKLKIDKEEEEEEQDEPAAEVVEEEVIVEEEEGDKKDQ